MSNNTQDFGKSFVLQLAPGASRSHGPRPWKECVCPSGRWLCKHELGLMTEVSRHHYKILSDSATAPIRAGTPGVPESVLLAYFCMCEEDSCMQKATAVAVRRAPSLLSFGENHTGTTTGRGSSPLSLMREIGNGRRSTRSRFSLSVQRKRGAGSGSQNICFAQISTAYSPLESLGRALRRVTAIEFQRWGAEGGGCFDSGPFPRLIRLLAA